MRVRPRVFLRHLKSSQIANGKKTECIMLQAKVEDVKSNESKITIIVDRDRNTT